MNIVDWLLILVALVSVGFFVYFAFFSELDLFGGSEEKISVEYTVKVEGVNARLFGLSVPDSIADLNADFIDKGDKVYDCTNGDLIGRISSVKYEQTVKSTDMVDENGSPIYAPYPGHIDLIITVSGSGLDTNGVYSINGYEIRVGSDIEFRTEGYTAVGKCINVSGKGLNKDG